MPKKKLDALFWGLRSDRGWLQFSERVMRDDNKPGHGIVLLRTRKSALKYCEDFELGKEYKPRRLRLTEA